MQNRLTPPRKIAQQLLTDRICGIRIRRNYQNGIVACDGSYHLRPFLLSSATATEFAWPGAVRSTTRFWAQRTQGGTLGPASRIGAALFALHLAISLMRLRQTQIADIARERHLRGGDTLRPQLMGQLFLRP